MRPAFYNPAEGGGAHRIEAGNHKGAHIVCPAFYSPAEGGGTHREDGAASVRPLQIDAQNLS